MTRKRASHFREKKGKFFAGVASRFANWARVGAKAVGRASDEGVATGAKAGTEERFRRFLRQSSGVANATGAKAGTEERFRRLLRQSSGVANATGAKARTEAER
ncbi:MAG: hypothetical protein IJO46_10820, partial [Thermoguttaceae bacterium]|nr:hypothetical protein [Thermoguttaceae bacterium]